MKPIDVSAIAKCKRPRRSPRQREKKDSVTERHQIYCGNAGCIRKVIGGNSSEVKSQWAKLMLKPHADEQSRESIDDGWFSDH